MREQSREELRKLLQSAIEPLEERELKQDLWPRMLRRLEQQSIRPPWFDWALVALVLIWFLLFPEVIPGLLYQL
jgi:hypothetical protein